jgi:Flp pilus assembly protein TadG
MIATGKPSSLFKRFKADQSGNVALMLGLAIVPFFLAAGAAIDFGRYTGASTHVQISLDAAALAAAAGTKVSDADRIKAAEATFDLNIKSGAAAQLDVKPAFKVEDKKIKASADLVMPTSFMALAGITSLNSQTTAEVGIQIDKKAEVVMVLDYSGSMWETAGSEVKYVAMKQAAISLVDDLAKTNPDKVKFGLVPFSNMVYTTLPSAHVVDAPGTTWTGCTLDRKNPYNLGVSTPIKTDDDTKWNPSIVPLVGTNDCTGYIGRNLKTLDLTKNFDSVTDQLSAMIPYDYTNISLGVEFGYHMLSPNAPFTSGADFDDEETRKFMVVLTDGDQTEFSFGPGGTRSKENGELNLEKLCESAKANKITIITVALDLGPGATRDRLRGCATDPDRDFFTPESSSDLSKAFETIKTAIAAQVYLSK